MQMIINTPYVSGKSTDEVAKSLEEASRLIFQWFSGNQFKGRPYFRKRAASPKRKKGTYFSFSRKKGHTFFIFKGHIFSCYSYADA